MHWLRVLYWLLFIGQLGRLLCLWHRVRIFFYFSIGWTIVSLWLHGRFSLILCLIGVLLGSLVLFWHWHSLIGLSYVRGGFISGVVWLCPILLLWDGLGFIFYSGAIRLSYILLGIHCVVIGGSRVVLDWLGRVVFARQGVITLTLIRVIPWLTLVCVCGVLGRLRCVLSWVSAVSGVSFVVVFVCLIIRQCLIRGLIRISSLIGGSIPAISLVPGGVRAALGPILRGVPTRRIAVGGAILGSILGPILLGLRFLFLLLLLLDYVIVASLALLHAQVHAGLLLIGDLRLALLAATGRDALLEDFLRR